MSDDLSDRAAMALMFGLFFLIGGVMLFDVMTDYREGVSVAHLLVESVVLLLAGVGCGVVLIRGYQARRSLATLRNDLQHAQRRADRAIRVLSGGYATWEVKCRTSSGPTSVAGCAAASGDRTRGGRTRGKSRPPAAGDG